jgi:hypothetical protein
MPAEAAGGSVYHLSIPDRPSVRAGGSGAISGARGSSGAFEPRNGAVRENDTVGYRGAPSRPRDQSSNQRNCRLIPKAWYVPVFE